MSSFACLSQPPASSSPVMSPDISSTWMHHSQHRLVYALLSTPLASRSDYSGGGSGMPSLSDSSSP
eukprot:5754516-Prorocentrum_lima.AAC.1